MWSHLLLGVSALTAFLLSEGGSRVWRLVPEMQIPSEGKGYALTEIGDLEIGRDGTLYVLQPNEQLVRVFDVHGAFRYTIGRRGEGPGEFRRPAQMGWKGDTLWITDNGLRRLSFFKPTGEFISSLTFVVPPLSDGFAPSGPGIPLADGSLLGVGQAPAPFIADGLVQSEPIFRTDRNGRVLNSITSVSVRNRVLALQHSNPRRRAGAFFGRQPFADDPLWAVAPDGKSILVVQRTATTGSRRNSTFEISKFLPTGKRIYSRQFAYRPKELPKRLIQTVLAQRVPTAMRIHGLYQGQRDAEKRIREALYLPPSLPPVTAVVVGQDGSIWLRREDSSETSVQWNVFDSSGSFIATFDAPADLAVLRADHNTVWGVRHDSLQTPYLVKYRVHAAHK